MGDLHAAFGWVVVVANAAVGIWALGAHWWPPLRARALWWATAAAEIAIFVQVGLGVAALGAAPEEPDDFHLFYGFVALATVGIVYSYAKTYQRQLEPYRYLLFGAAGLFLMGLGLRAMQFT